MTKMTKEQVLFLKKMLSQLIDKKTKHAADDNLITFNKVTMPLTKELFAVLQKEEAKVFQCKWCKKYYDIFDIVEMYEDGTSTCYNCYDDMPEDWLEYED